VHDVSHVSQLKKYLHVREEQISMEDLDAREALISRVPCQAFRDVQESHPEQQDQDVHGALEPPY
jgi:hypothetical protein